ncbi:hypothetical protein ACFQX7_17315 [Luedemannella flava]
MMATALLTATSPDVFVDRLMVLDHMARTKHRALRRLGSLDRGLRARQHDLAKLAHRLAAQHRTLAADRAEVLSEITRLEELRARHARRAGTGWGRRSRRWATTRTASRSGR